MQPAVLFILLAAFGAVCQEVLHWFDLRNKLLEVETKNLLHSSFYWIITFTMILVSGIGTWILFYDNAVFTNRIPFVLGAAFPVLFKKIVEAVQKRDLGRENVEKSPSFATVAKKYFQ